MPAEHDAARIRPRHRRRRTGRRLAGAGARAARAAHRADRGRAARCRASSTRVSTNARPRSPTARCARSGRSACGRRWSARPRRSAGSTSPTRAASAARASTRPSRGSRRSATCVPNRVIGAALWARPGARARGRTDRAGAGHGQPSSTAASRIVHVRSRGRDALAARAAGRRRRRRALAGARPGRHRRRPHRLRAGRDHRRHDHAALPRPRRVRALHRRRPDRDPAADRRPLRHGLDAPARGGRAAARARRTTNSCASSRPRSASGSAASCAIGQRASYKLTLSRAERHIAPRLAVVGNAAQGLHPIAGQGFNLGLARRDEPGRSHRRPARGRHDRRRRSRRCCRTTPTGARPIVAASSPSPTAWCGCSRARSACSRSLRSLGILAFDVLPPAKSALARLSVGAAERVPRLARGVPLAGAR